jgi:cardiolipin synthase
MISKLNTLVQLMLVCAVIVHYGMIPLPEILLTGLIALTAITTVWSGSAYVRQWSQRARNRRRNRSLDDA